MLKIRKSKVKFFGAITCLSLLGMSYLGLSFYSIPEKVSAAEDFTEWRKLENITYMQEMTIDICNNSDIGDRKALIDKRGGGYTNDPGRQNSYIVQKLTDGNCWMVQNMNLTNKAITSADSNVTSNYTIPASVSPWSDTSVTTNKVHYPNASNPDGDTHKYGAYYTWYTATAGTGGSSVTSGDVNGSICPKGWKLPTSNKAITVDGSFNKLTIDPLTGKPYATNDDANYKANAWKTNQTDTTLGNSFGITTATNGAVFSAGFFPAAGRVYDGSLNGVGTAGLYWSSTAYDSAFAYYLNFYSSSVNPSSYSLYRYLGNSVRCVANPAIKSSDLTDTSFGNIDANVNVHVGPIITIDAATGMSGQVDYTKVLEGSISATISSNLNYKVLLSAKEPSLIKSGDNTSTITPVLSMNTILEKGVTGWGIWTGNGTTTETKTYNPITTTEHEYYNTTTPADDGIGTVHTFGVGIAVSPSIPNGTYSTIVTVTAANA